MKNQKNLYVLEDIYWKLAQIAEEEEDNEAGDAANNTAHELFKFFGYIPNLPF